MSFGRKIFLTIAAGILGLYAAGCRAPFREMDEASMAAHNRAVIQSVGNLERITHDMMDDIKYKEKYRFPRIKSSLKLSDYKDALGDGYGMFKQIHDISETASAAKEGINFLTSTLLTDITGRMPKDIEDYLFSKGKDSDVDELYEKFKEKNKNYINRTKSAFADMNHLLNGFDYKSLESLKEKINQLKAAGNDAEAEMISGTIDSYEKNLKEIQRYLKIHTWILASESCDSVLKYAIELDDKIQKAVTGDNYVESGKKVIETKYKIGGKEIYLKDMLKEQAENAKAHYESRDQHCLDDIAQDNRDLIAKQIFELYKKKKIDFEEFIGALYYMDQELREDSEKWPGAGEVFAKTLARWIPPVALIDVIKNQNPSYLFLRDTIKEGEMKDMLEEMSAAYMGATNYRHHVGNNHAWKELGYNALIMGTQAALLNHLYGADSAKGFLGGGGRGQKVGGVGVKGGK